VWFILQIYHEATSFVAEYTVRRDKKRPAIGAGLIGKRTLRFATLSPSGRKAGILSFGKMLLHGIVMASDNI
jgi:hypothetical protein